MPNPDTYGIYLHIPYCRSKCRYCDFYSAPGTRGVPDEYVTALLRELSKSSRRPDTLYFGGGTPALLRPDQVHRLIKAAAPLPGAEITLEANPDVVTPENLAGFAAAGVTRISFGVQSADNMSVVYLDLGRPEEAIPYLTEALELTKENGLVGSAVAEPTWNLARVYRALGDEEKEDIYLKAAVEGFRECYPPEHPKRIAAEQRLKERQGE